MARRPPAEAVGALHRRLARLAPRDPERARLVASTAELYGISRATLYRGLKDQLRPKAVRRGDRGVPRKLPAGELARCCEIIAALKVRTTNGKGRHLSTARAIDLLEEHGVETPDGHVRPARGLLKKTTVNHYLRQWGYDHGRLTGAPPGGPVRGRAQQRALAARPQPLGPEAGRGPSLGGARPRRADADALQRRR